MSSADSAEFWSSWLSSASVNPLSSDFYAHQLAGHRVDSERVHLMSVGEFTALGLTPHDAELCVRYARECNSLWDEFGRQFASDSNVIDMAPLQAECQPAPTQPTKKRAHHAASSAADDFKPPLPLSELVAAMRSNAQQTPSHLTAAPLGPFDGLSGFMPLAPGLQSMFGGTPLSSTTTSVAAAAAPPPPPPSAAPLMQPSVTLMMPNAAPPPPAAAAAANYSIVIVDEPADPVMSARSAHVYTLRIHGPHIDKVTVFTETEACDKTSDGVLVENSTAQPASNDPGCIVLQVRLRFKAHRLQVRRAVFECVVKAHVADPGGATIVARSSPFIVCSHITSQRQQALERLETARSRTTVGALQDRIVQCYRECNFVRQLTPHDLVFLRDTAVQQAGAEGAGAVTDATLVKVAAFWEWLRKAIKLLVRLRPYWESGVIAGFVGRNDAVDMLADQPDGVCVVRFSSSVPKAFAVTCKIGGAVSNKMIDKTAAGDWKLFTSSLRSFSGNLTHVVDIHGRSVPLDFAFPPIPSVEEPPTPKLNDDLGYDETRSVNELVNAMRGANLN